jgi:hypothetical protein
MLACLRSSPVEALLCMCPDSLYLLFISIKERRVGILYRVLCSAVYYFPVENFHVQN